MVLKVDVNIEIFSTHTTKGSATVSKVKESFAAMPGAVAAMLLLPIPVAFPKLKNGLPEHG